MHFTFSGGCVSHSILLSSPSFATYFEVYPFNSFDLLRCIVTVLYVDAGYHCDLAIAMEPHILRKQLRLALETFALFMRPKLDLPLHKRLCGEGCNAVSARKHLERF
jgi:hypothetical protein